MTTIIYKDGTFAWDTQVTWNGRSHIGDVKVFRNGPVVFGVAGDGRVANVFKCADIPDLNDYEPGFSVERWIIKSLVPSLMGQLQELGAASIENSRINSETHTIIWVRGEVFYLSGDGCVVSDETGVYAVGSGSEFALGAVEAGASPRQAVKIATHLDLYSGGEVQTLEVGN